MPSKILFTLPETEFLKLRILICIGKDSSQDDSKKEVLKVESSNFFGKSMDKILKYLDCFDLRKHLKH